MNREEYNACMKPYMSGSKSKEQRQRDFCVGAKVCSGKAKTEDEAIAICSTPKLPKWAKALLPKKQEPATCQIKDTRAKENLELILLKVNEGEPEDARPLAAQTLNDILTCHAKDTAICELAIDAMQDFNDISKRPFLTGEVKDLKSKIETVKATL